MTDRLTALDATFLELEQADQGAHMHIGGVMVFEPREDGPPSTREVAATLGSRLAGLPRYRQRLAHPKTGGLRWPEWVEDEGFDPAAHVRRARVPGSGTEADLTEWAGEYFSERLDRTRPLWEIVVLDGLANGRWALVSKTHHCIVDGVGSVDAAKLMLDAEREPAPQPDAAAAPPPAGPAPGDAPGRELPSALRLAGRAARVPLMAARLGGRAAAAAGALVGRGAGVAAHPDRAADVLQRSRALVDVLVKDELVAAPRTSLNDPIGGRRRLGVVEVELADVKQIKQALGGTVNDVLLAAAAGAFRETLIARGEEPPERGLRAMVPVNIRTAGEHLALGNRITSLFVHLPVAEADTARRYALQMEDAEALKAGSQGLGASAITDLAGLAPPIIHGFLARSLFATRLFNITITNVPGPQMPLYAFGSKMLSVWPIVPLAAEHAVGLAIFSYDGRLFLCVNADRDSVPDLDVLVGGLRSSLAELGALAQDAEGPRLVREASRDAAAGLDAVAHSSVANRLMNGALFV